MVEKASEVIGEFSRNLELARANDPGLPVNATPLDIARANRVEIAQTLRHEFGMTEDKIARILYDDLGLDEFQVARVLYDGLGLSPADIAREIAWLLCEEPDDFKDQGYNVAAVLRHGEGLGLSARDAAIALYSENGIDLTAGGVACALRDVFGLPDKEIIDILNGRDNLALPVWEVNQAINEAKLSLVSQT